MNFKSNEDIKKLRSLEYYLDPRQKISPYWKEIIIRKLKAIFAMPSGIDSEPMDAYRVIGQQSIRIELIEELNSIIMEQTTNYHFIKVWAKELYELWKLSHEMRDDARSMALSLRANGFTDGFYDPNTMIQVDCPHCTIKHVVKIHHNEVQLFTCPKTNKEYEAKFHATKETANERQTEVPTRD
jgi:hypothetical protein